MSFTRLTDIRTAPVEWLWPDHLALGHLHLLDGDLDRGKSLLMSDLAARLTTGGTWPDGSPVPGYASVVYCSTEDEPGLIRARLSAAGAEPTRAYVWTPSPQEPQLCFPKGIEPLADIVRYAGARLLILDPIFAFLPAQCALGSDPAMRAALAPLAALAREARCAVVLIRHLRKTRADQALYRGLGSIALSALCRLVWIVGPDREQADRFGFAVAKNNLGPTPPSLSYSFAAHDATARLTWHGVTPWTAEALVGRRRHAYSRLTPEELLTQMLASGPRQVSELRTRAKRHRLSMKSLRDAAKGLKIKFDRVGNQRGSGQKTYWLLPGQLAPGRDPEIEALFQRFESKQHAAEVPKP